MNNMGQRRSIPWAQPKLYGSEETFLIDALRSSWISGGPYIARLEQTVAERMEVNHAVAVSNGTTAIELALRCLGIGPGEEVIVPGFTFVAAANMVLSLGATPLYADVTPDTWLLDPQEIHRLATVRTKAVIPVHLYGNVADMDLIGAAAAEHGLTVVEDAAEAAFSQYRHAYAGTIGRLGTLSFHAAKTITTGEGGMVLTNDPALADTMRVLRDHGRRAGRRYWHDVVGYNYRLTNLQAAMGCGQLMNLGAILEERKRIHAFYRRLLTGVPGLDLQCFKPTVDPVLWAMTVRLNSNEDNDILRRQRDTVMKGMAEDGIETRPGFYALSLLPPYDCPDLPVASRLSASVLSLPTYVGLTDEDMHRIWGSLQSPQGSR